MNHVICSEVSDENINSFKHLHTCIFPANYPSKFYKEIFNKNSINKIAVIGEQSVGVLTARVLESDHGKSLYLTSLGCKVLFRRRGVGSLLLTEARKFALSHDCKHIRLHVQEGNEAAIDFYKDKGFQIESVVPGYYTRLQPSNAFLMFLNIDNFTDKDS